ncbi:OmpA family protein [Sphingomonas sp. BN140010]|uniref:OmpA family protein n=1 Tax=Sphingomonas arvum TaxID=2992113 RepID=A0ABT3JDD7_9SPHN|nr:OmpA family protein [Sphingomonas sp. BN140010]MCW3796780.1 OmpA family protein [Sphingomonas sp. BN140010]
MLLLLLAALTASPSAPEPAPQSIYFDSGKGSEIRPEWTEVLDAVAASLRQRGGRVRLDGFSDRSGPEGANRRVSAERGQAVRAALIERGVPSGSIAAVVHGEDDSLVPTADGVREPQNRRVDLTLLP